MTLKKIATLICVCVGLTANAQYKTEWTNVSSSVIVNADNSITKTNTTDTGFNGGAASINVLPAGVDGWVEFTFTANTTNAYGIGLSAANTGTHSLTSINYSFSYSSGTVRVSEKAATRKTLLSVTTGQKLKISRTGATISYYRNNALEYTSTVSSTTDLYIRASISKGTIPIVTSSFGLPFVLSDFSVKQLEASPLVKGELSVSISGGLPPYDLRWSDNFSGNSRTELLPGIYALNASDADGHHLTKVLPVGYKIYWVELTSNAVINSDNSLTNTFATPTGWSQGGRSDNVLSAGRDGWVSFTCGSLNSSAKFAVGFNELGATPSASLTDLDYAISYESGFLKVYSRNAIVVYEDLVNQLKKGEVLRIERSGTNIICYRDATVLHTFTNVSQGKLVADVSIHTGSTPVISASFARLGDQAPPQYKPDENRDKNWSATVTYDENGNVIGQSKTFFDHMGRPLQSQIKDPNSEHIWAAQTLYDTYGRVAIESLPAPIDNSGFNYKNNFIVSGTGENYEVANFDGEKINSPDPVGSEQAGTLGWYYSTNNSLETTTAITGYPYQRIEYDDNGGSIKRSAGAGDHHRMGSGHEVKGRVLPTLTELDHYAVLRDQFVNTPSNSLAFVSSKSINIDENGKEAVIFSDASGQNIASCFSGARYPGITVNVLLEEYPTCTQRIITQRRDVETGPVYISGDYVEIYDIENENNLIFRGDPAGVNFDDQIPGSRPVEYRSHNAFVVRFSYHIANRRSYSQPIPISAIIGRKNFVDLHISEGGPANLTFTGSGNPIEVYDLSADISVYQGSASGIPSLNPGFYRIKASPGAGSYTITYNLHYGDFSYAYYDDLGQVVATVTPNGVNLNDNNSFPDYVTLYKYNSAGWLLSATSPDEGLTEFVYSKDGSIRFSQNAVQRETKKYSYTNYDQAGRLIEAGEYQMPEIENDGFRFQNHLAEDVLVNSILNPTILENRTTSGGLDEEGRKQRINIWYDFPFDDLELNGRKQEFLIGRISKTQNENAATWYSYNEKGQITWVVQSIAGLGILSQEYTYDHIDNVMEVSFKKDGANVLFHHYTYDKNQRLTKVETSLDGVSKKLQAKYLYSLDGSLKRLELGDNLQGIDYVYGINGALKSINHADKDQDPGGDGNDIFGMTFQYHNNDYAGAGYALHDIVSDADQEQFNGMPKTIAWHSPANLDGAGAYSFSYDEKYQFKQAKFGQLNINSDEYSFAPGDAYNEQVSLYDANGNIKSLLRKGKHGGVNENYTYEYEIGTNRLDYIHTGADQIDYSYNSLGQLTGQTGNEKDLLFKYNLYGLVEEVTKVVSNEQKLLQKNFYDDRGDIVKKVLYRDGEPAKALYYVNDIGGAVVAIYEQALPSGSMQLIELPIYGMGRVGIYKPQVDDTYFYEVSDHQGNVRGVIGKPETETFPATFEIDNSQYEALTFENYNENYADWDLFDHTDMDGDVYTYSQLLNGGYAGKIGLAKSLEVFPGDVVKAEVYAKYEESSVAPGDITGFTIALLSAFNVSPPAPGETGTLSSELDQYGAMVEANRTDDFEEDPKGFISILVFDKTYNLVEYSHEQLDAAYDQPGKGKQKEPFHHLVVEKTITEPGYVYIFLSNEGASQQNIYFDDFKITHEHSPIVAGADYYPFGMVMEERSITKEYYRYGYQGLFSEKNDSTGYNEFDLRYYDAKIARWLTTDPYGQYYSPYTAMGNSPHMSIDPDGGFNWGATAVGAVAGFTVGSLVGLAVDKENWWKYGVAGAAVGGIIGASTPDLTISESASGWTEFRAEVKQAILGGRGAVTAGRHTYLYGPGQRASWQTLASLGVPAVRQSMSLWCVFGCSESLNSYFGGSTTQTAFSRSYNGSVVDRGVQSDADLIRYYSNNFRIGARGRSLPSPTRITGYLNSNNPISISVDRGIVNGQRMAHNMVITGIQQNTKTKKYRLLFMDPAGQVNRASYKAIKNVHRYYFVILGI